MYQQIYSFEHSSGQTEQDGKPIYFDCQQQDEHFSQLANEFTIRYPTTFDQHTHNTFDPTSCQDLMQDNNNNNNNNRNELQTFNSFHTINSEQDIVSSLTQESSIYDSILQGNSSNSGHVHPSPLIAKTTINTLPPLNATPIKIAPLQNHPSANHHTYLLASKKPLKGSPRPSRERAPWTPEEDNLLRLAVQLYGDKTEKWSKIAACVPGRTNKNCRKRWFHSLDPSLRKGAWTDEEDQLLREGVSKYPNQWSKIADMLEGRTDDQCAKRWRESLDPSIDRSEWTAEEDKRLMEKYEEYGSQWQKIAYFFEGRPGLHCRNRWRKLQRMMQMKKDKQVNIPFVNHTLAKSDSQRLQPFCNNDNNNTSLLNNNPAYNNDNLVNSTTTTHNANMAPTVNTTHTSTMTQLLSNTTSDNNAATAPSTMHNNNPNNNSSNDVLIHYTAAPSNQMDDEFKDGLTPYGCDIPGCYAEFPSSTALFYHMKKAHPNLEGIDKPYRCAMANCAKKYKNINGLQYHLKDAKGTTGHGHSNLLGEDKPYRCAVVNCKKAYRTANGLRYHEQHGHTKDQQEPQIIPFDQYQSKQKQ
ncbi:hypothetical protein G6F70_005088 [Rhizopus microsporus]|uniref:Homeodomain-like protein n=2 Tax=Rhizopus microsporus TaxID=58291 RepID=A0A1X0RUR6_RHIZD|nr:hypothetical protein G6F71_007080 [Rhizopus microsporus]KAG1199264.1 hypothetical protein G6F70_005088 [Rhizopus microsporus]KAG1213383.1 hypothetical protein G6F69_002848 [Rhizopus microsporus]KAG1230032.1 hypothetical protein G6F67_006744 [Rhizopus microsporus]KAG1267614.1 hypothetical protein G6F68_001766 [Rhizopus microsporus]